MTGVLESAVSEFLDGLANERRFDAPLLALLRLQGFYDIRFLHGTFEFGKDFIAKRVDGGAVVQYAFQSKLGDIGKTKWEREIQPQCVTMSYTKFGHPAFDSSLPRRNVVVLTGRLKGQARMLAEAYQVEMAARSLPPLEIWEKDTLVTVLSASNCLGLSFDWPAFGHFIHAAGSEAAALADAEVYTQRWIEAEDEGSLWQSALEYSLVREELDRRELGFHSFRLSLGLIRAAVVFGERSSAVDPYVATLIGLLQAEIQARGRAIVAWSKRYSDKGCARALAGPPPASLVMLGLHGVLLSEIVALYVLTLRHNDAAELRRASAFFRRMLSYGAMGRPMSDEYAVAVLAIGVAAHLCGVGVEAWLVALAEWVREAHKGDNPVGLAPPRSAPTDELWRTLARMVDNPSVPSRRETFLGAAVLDTCSVLGNGRAYVKCHRLLVQNDLLVPERFVPKLAKTQFRTGLSGAIRVLGGEYPSEWSGRDGWKNGPAHEFGDVPREFDRRGEHWLGVALSLLLRDRWWLHSFRALVSASLQRKASAQLLGEGDSKSARRAIKKKRRSGPTKRPTGKPAKVNPADRPTRQQPRRGAGSRATRTRSD